MKKRTNQLISLLIGFVGGLAKHHASSANLTLNGVATTTQDLATAFKAVVVADEAVKAADAQRAEAIVVANTLAEGILPQAKAFKAFLMATFGTNPGILADFDLKPRKVAVITSEARSAAATKAAATRAALGTKGAARDAHRREAMSWASRAARAPSRRGARSCPGVGSVEAGHRHRPNPEL